MFPPMPRLGDSSMVKIDVPTQVSRLQSKGCWKLKLMERLSLQRLLVAAIEGGFHQALLAADLGKLESLLDETFIWTHDTGQRKSRQQLLDDVKSGRLRYSKLETNSVRVSIYGDTGVVRGCFSSTILAKPRRQWFG
jgi:hypothetical protein